MPSPALIPLSSAAQILGGVSTRTVRRLIQDGALSAFHVRGRIMNTICAGRAGAGWYRREWIFIGSVSCCGTRTPG